MKSRIYTLLFCSPAILFPAVVVNFNSSTQTGGNLSQPTIVSDNVELGGGFGDDQVTRITLADNATPWSSTNGTYNGPEFLLMWEGTAYNESAGWDSRDSSPLSIRMQTNGTDIGGVPGKNGAGNFHLAVLFPTVSSYQFDATSSLTIDLQRQDNSGTMRWMVRNGGTYYVSQSTISGDTTLDQGAGLLTENWAVYDVATSPDFDQGSAVFSTPTSSLTSIDGFGFMTDKDTISSVRHWVDLRGFQADAAIPEPGTLVLVGMSMLILLGVRRGRTNL